MSRMTPGGGKPKEARPAQRSFAINFQKQEELPPPQSDNSLSYITGATFRLQQEAPPELDKADWAEERKQLCDRLHNPVAETCLSWLIVASVILLVLEVDQHAWRGKPEDPTYPHPALWLVITSKILVCFFFIEILARLYLYRRAFLIMGFGLDLVVVMIDFTLAVVDLALGVDGLSQMTYLRVFRLIRILRMRRVILQYPELCYLISGIASSIRAIAWGVIMVYILIVIWALVGVSLVHPVARQAALNNPNCGHRCLEGFSSIWHAILTLSQTLVYGDSWGATALPIIEESKLSFVYFLSAYSTVALAALNLILAAIVDSGAQAREQAALAREERQRERHKEDELERTRYLLSLCQQLDRDDSGSLTLNELLSGFDTNKNFAKTMEQLHLEKSDIEIFYTVVDKDGSGEVDYKEFLHLVTEARKQASQQVLTFVKFAVLDMRAKARQEFETLEEQIQELKQFLLPRQPDAPATKGAPESKKPTEQQSTKGKQQRELNKSKLRADQKITKPLQVPRSPDPPQVQPLHKQDFEPIEQPYPMHLWQDEDETPEAMPRSRRSAQVENANNAVNGTPAPSFLHEHGGLMWHPEVHMTAEKVSSDMKRLLENVERFQSCLASTAYRGARELMHLNANSNAPPRKLTSGALPDAGPCKHWAHDPQTPSLEV